MNAAAVWACVLGGVGILTFLVVLWGGLTVSYFAIPSFLALGFGVRAVRQIKQDPGQRGKTPAWVGIALGALPVALVTIYVPVGLFTIFGPAMIVNAVVLIILWVIIAWLIRSARDPRT